jgi:DNA-binding transcriptional MocR family regulator
MTIWCPNKDDIKRPAYKSLATIILTAIDTGELKGGDQLPPHRELAYQLGLSVQTISRAYEELIRINAISGEVGRGTFINSIQSDTRSPHFYLPADQRSTLIDLSVLKPVCDQIHIDHMRAALSDLSTNLPTDVVHSFRPASAHHFYGEKARAWIAKCGVLHLKETVLLTNGNTSSMTVALMTAAKPGDIVVTEEIGHHTLKPLMSYLGLRLKGLKLDHEGILSDDFERLCVTQPVKALYIMPTGLNPTATTMGLERRKVIIEIARKYDVLIIENDAWGPIQPNRPPPIAALAPERALYFTSLTKCIMPGLRVGYLVVPDTLSAAAKNRHLVTNWMATSLMAEIASRWIENGVAEELLDWQKAALRDRNQIATRHLQEHVFHESPNGMHIWLPLPSSWSEQAFVDHANQNGVAVAPGSSFSISDTPTSSAVRVCLGTSSREQLSEDLKVISKILKSQPEPTLLSI